MKVINPNAAACSFVICATLFLSSCTLHYRSVQYTYERAVQADNRELSLGNIVTQDQNDYEHVINTLTESYISNLDPRLRPNAFLLRSMSQLQVGNLEKAAISAEKGDNAGGKLEDYKGSRDDILLGLMPSLVAFKPVEHANPSSKLITQEKYDEYYALFKLAMTEWEAAEQRANLRTPRSVQHYLQFHRWRMIATWNSNFILQIDANSDGKGDDSDTLARKKARTDTGNELFNGISPSDAAKSAKRAVPNGPLRELMEIIKPD